MDKSFSKFSLAEKYRGTEDNIWLVLRDLNPNGDKLSLGSGYPDFYPDPTKKIVQHLAATCNSEKIENNLHQYTRSFGHPRLVKALANLYGKLINREIDPMNEVLVSIGAYGALFSAVMSNVGIGDEVIIIEPFFDCYEPFVKIAGGTCVFISLKRSESSTDSNDTDTDETSASWKLDFKELSKLFNEKTKAIILNTPNNPLGKVFSLEELTEIADLCKKWNVLVISDEVYEFLVYEGKEHIRIASIEGMWERTITIGSAGKVFSLTGWRLGWSYGHEKLMKNVQVAHVHLLYNCQTTGQEVLGQAIEQEIEKLGKPDSFFIELQNDLKIRRDFLVKALRDSKFKPIVPDAGYMVLADWTPLEKYIDLSQYEQDNERDVKFCKWLGNSKNLISVPPSAFYTQRDKHEAVNLIRFCFYKSNETLEKAKSILLSIQEL